MITIKEGRLVYNSIDGEYIIDTESISSILSEHEGYKIRITIEEINENN